MAHVCQEARLRTVGFERRVARLAQLFRIAAILCDVAADALRLAANGLRLAAVSRTACCFLPRDPARPRNRLHVFDDVRRMALDCEHVRLVPVVRPTRPLANQMPADKRDWRIELCRRRRDERSNQPVHRADRDSGARCRRSASADHAAAPIFRQEMSARPSSRCETKVVPIPGARPPPTRRSTDALRLRDDRRLAPSYGRFHSRCYTFSGAHVRVPRTGSQLSGARFNKI